MYMYVIVSRYTLYPAFGVCVFVWACSYAWGPLGMEWRRRRPLPIVSVRWSRGSAGVLRAAQLPVLTVLSLARCPRQVQVNGRCREVVFCTRCLMVIYYNYPTPPTSTNHTGEPPKQGR